jgi:hypothetical protein
LQGSAEAKKVKLEWKPLEGAVGYELKIQSETGVLIQKKTEDSLWKGDLSPGAYSYQIRAIDEVKRPGVWSEPLPLAVLPTAPQPKFPPDGSQLEFYNPKLAVPLKWEPIPGVNSYLIELKRDGKVVSKTRVNGTQYDYQNLPPGKYSWQISAVLESGKRAPASLQGKHWETPGGETGDFKVEYKNLETPQVVSPKAIEPPPENGKLRFRWKEVEGAQLYQLHVVQSRRSLPPGRSLASELTSAKKIYTKDHFIDLKLPGEGTYAWGVRALANLDENQVAQAVGPETLSQFRVDRNAIFHGDLGYLAASVMLAPYDYQINSPANQVQGSTQSVAFVYRLSGEYVLHPQWAIASGVDYANFQILQNSFNRLSGELFLKYRMNLTSGNYGWFFSPKIGTEFREFNEIVPSDSTQPNLGVTSNKISILGASLGFDLRKQFSESFSIGVKVGYFRPIFFIGGSPTGSQFSGSANQRNLSLGIQGLYWLNPTWGIGAGGYFEKRSLSFSTPNQSSPEEIYMDGSYFFGSVVYRIWK